MDIGFTAVAEVFFELWDKALRDSSLGLDIIGLKSSAEMAIKSLRAFQNVFPIGQPHTPYYRGWYAQLTGKHQQAVKLWRKSLEAARKFNMPYEEAQACFRLASSLPADDPTRKDYLAHALTVFEAMGCPYELEAAKAIM
jgi:hypothetical protein